MSVLDNDYITLEEFKMHLHELYIKLGRTADGLVYDAKMIDGIPTLVIRADEIVVKRLRTVINLNSYGFRRLYQDGYTVKIEYDPSYEYGDLTIKIAMDGLTPTAFRKLLEGIPIDSLVLNMYGKFDCRLKEYFTKKMNVKALTITDKDLFDNKPSAHRWCNLTIPAGFWKICSKLTIDNMKSIKLGGGVDGYESLTIRNSKK